MDLHTRPGPADDRERAGEHAVAEILVPTRPEYVAMARAAVRQAAVDAGLEANRVDDLLLCVSEACTNAIEAELVAGVDTAVEIRCLVGPESIAVEIRDAAGGGFDASTLVARPPLAHPGHLDVERGWGVQLMRELVDEVTFDALEDGTVVRLVVRF